MKFIFSKIDARNGAFGIIPEELDGAIVTNDFPVFDIDETIINPTFLLLVTTTKAFVKFVQSLNTPVDIYVTESGIIVPEQPLIKVFVTVSIIALQSPRESYLGLFLPTAMDLNFSQ